MFKVDNKDTNLFQLLGNGNDCTKHYGGCFCTNCLGRICEYLLKIWEYLLKIGHVQVHESTNESIIEFINKSTVSK